MDVSLTTDASAIIQEMEREHDELSAVMARLRGMAPEQLPDLWDGLMAYAREHFRKEEQVMSLLPADAQASHVQDHERLLATLADLRLVLDHPHLLLDRLGDLLQDWLSDHIGNHDERLMAELTRQRAAERAWEVRPVAGGG